jgi:hypothetical protein
MSSRMLKVLNICAWSGPATVAVTFIGWLIAGVLPFPLGPASSLEQVTSFYTDDNTLVKVGLVVATIGISLTLPLCAAISVHMVRMEGRTPILSFLQLASAAVSQLLLLLPLLLMAVIAFGAPARMSESLVFSLNDIAWLLFITPIAPVSVQMIAIGVAILNDETKIFPRWVGYLNFWIAASFLPDVLAYFFFSGPFGWNGIFIFWLATTTYAIFLFVMPWAVRRANAELFMAESQAVAAPA